jgi:Phosphosulfolactate phosphohydrolase and related enzymes
MQLHVYMSPADVLAVYSEQEQHSTATTSNDVFIVIDLVRATTAITTIFDSGAARVFIADSVAQAREARQRYPQRLLAGERNALPLPGFDYGNSPAQFAQTPLHERDLILTTTNGTRAFFACPTDSLRLAGCFYNAAAVTTYAVQQARQQGGNIGIVCAAEMGYFALDDSVCAGYLAQEIQHLQPDIECHESVTAAQGLYQLYPPSILAEYCHSTRQVIDAGLGADIAVCMRQNASQSIGKIVGQEADTGLLILTRI